MPIYIYECMTCGEHSEQLLLKRDETPEPCVCGSEKLEKRPTTASPRFKGSGWGDAVDVMGGAANMRLVQGD